MRNYTRKFVFNTHCYLAMALAVVLCAACEGPTASGPDSTHVRVVATQNRHNVPPVAPQASIEATLRHWTDREILVDYVLHNDSDIELVVFDNSRSLQIERRTDGGVRLLQGKQNTGSASFESAPTIPSRILKPSMSMNGTGSRAIPLQLDYSSDGNWLVYPNPDSVEFCIGFGSLNDLLPTRDDFGSYSLNQDLELQRFTCTVLKKPSNQTPDNMSSPSDEDWKRTLDVVLGAMNDRAVFIALYPAATLKVPEIDTEGRIELASIVQDNGEIGTQYQVRCPDGGEYHLTTSASAGADEYLTAFDCVFGREKINGQVERSIQVGERGEPVTRVSLSDFSYVDDHVDVHVSKGIYDFDNGYPFSTEVLSGMDYRVKTAGVSYAVSNAEWKVSEMWGDVLDRSINASFAISAASTSNRSVQVNTPVPLAGQAVGAGTGVQNGQLVLAADQQNRLQLDIDSAHQQGAAMLTIERPGVVTTSFVPWAEIF